ncbi:MAG: SDR family NAD(P)-dependent oxidoreductase, partial [Bryobacteraceae bacterium]
MSRNRGRGLHDLRSSPCEDSAPPGRANGKIINIAAGVHEERVHVGMSAYCASKIGLVNLTRSLAAEVRQHGIHVNAIDPGAVRTGMAESFEISEETTAWLAKQQTLDVPAELRFRPPGHIVPLAVFL